MLHEFIEQNIILCVQVFKTKEAQSAFIRAIIYFASELLAEVESGGEL